MIFNFSLPEDFLKKSPITNLSLPDAANGLVVHCCCAPCATGMIEALLCSGIKPIMFFYNPNIYPLAEYEKRRDEWIYLCNLLKLEYHVGDYDYQKYLETIKGLEQEPERGNRCKVCYRMRMEKTAIIAKENNYDYFCTTLSVSPYKNSQWINEIGKELENKYSISWLYSDFKKKDGYKQSILLSQKYNLYRQNYCGCIYSKPQ